MPPPQRGLLVPSRCKLYIIAFEQLKNHQLLISSNDLKKKRKFIAHRLFRTMAHILRSKLYELRLSLLPRSLAIPGLALTPAGRHLMSSTASQGVGMGRHDYSALSQSAITPLISKKALCISHNTSRASFQMACVRVYTCGGFHRSFSLHTHADQDGARDYPKPKDIHIPLDKVQFAFARSSGPGGQNVNKLNTKAELRFVGEYPDQWLAVSLYPYMLFTTPM